MVRAFLILIETTFVRLSVGLLKRIVSLPSVTTPLTGRLRFLGCLTSCLIAIMLVLRCEGHARTCVLMMLFLVMFRCLGSPLLGSMKKL